MADLTINYKGQSIVELSESGTKTLKTAGKYCEGDITVEYAKPAGGGDVEHYDGAYDVTPLITAQVLPTRDKLMDDNVRVDMIQTREKNNDAGGVTFIVGG